MLRRTRVTVFLAAGLITVLGACGAQPESTGDGPATGPPATTPPPPPSASPTTADPTTAKTEPGTPSGTASTPPEAGTRCGAANLTGTVAPSDASAGNRYAELVVTNRSGRTCTIYGYGGLQLVAADGRPTPTRLTRQADPGPALVTLPPGGTAAKTLHWSVVPGGNEPVTGPCQPSSAGARVIPPDDTRAFAVTYDFGSVCSGGRVDGGAYVRK
jgi:hypothetical protein